MCSVQDCVGDEVCAARQDIVVAVDGSGAQDEAAFDALRRTAVATVSRLTARRVGESAMVGLLQFGTAGLSSCGEQVAAQAIQNLTSDVGAVRRATEGLRWLHGLPNSAEAMLLAERMLRLRGRPGAEAALLLLGAGAPDIDTEARSQAQRLQDRHVRVLYATLPAGPGHLTPPRRGWTRRWDGGGTRSAPLLSLDAGDTSLDMVLQTAPDALPDAIFARLCPAVVSPGGWDAALMQDALRT